MYILCSLVMGIGDTFISFENITIRRVFIVAFHYLLIFIFSMIIAFFVFKAKDVFKLIYKK